MVCCMFECSLFVVYLSAACVLCAGGQLCVVCLRTIYEMCVWVQPVCCVLEGSMCAVCLRAAWVLCV